MADDGETKDDVKVPDGEVGDKIDKLFTTDEKDTSKIRHFQDYISNKSLTQYFSQTSSFSLLWVSRLLLKPRRLLAVKFPPTKTLRHRPCCQQWHTLIVCRPFELEEGYPIATALDSLDFSGPVF